MSLAEPVRTQIESLLQQNRVVLFMKGNKNFPQCGFSAQVVKILGTVGVPYQTVNVLADQGIREGIKEYAQWPTIPQLYVDGQFVGGCDIVRDLFTSGQLHGLLGAAAPEKAAPTPPAPAKLPVVHLDDKAAQAVKQADDGSGDTLRVGISPAFAYELFFGAKEDDDVEITANGVVIRLDPASAGRADGLRIEWVESDGAFRIESPQEPARVRSLTPADVKKWLDQGEDFELIDVRTEGERRTAKLAKARHLDAETEAFLADLDKDKKLVFQCHHGMRSRAAAERYLGLGFRRVYNLEGGIDAWSQQVDPTVPRY
jgi:monothiol glutaredoxin